MSDGRELHYPLIQAFFVGGAGDEVTGSGTVLKIHTSDGRVRYVMIDAGATQGAEEYRNNEYPILGEKIEAVLLTHSHYDHVGNLALLYKLGFRGKVFATSTAKELIHTMLQDGATIADRKKNIARRDEKMIEKLRKRLVKKRQKATNVHDMKALDIAIEQIGESDFEPLFTHEDVDNVMELFASTNLYSEFEILDGIYCKFIPTTHQLGAVRIEVIVRDPNGESYTIMFSGDIGPTDSLMYETKLRTPNEHVDCVVMESLHGVSEPEEPLYVSIRRLREIIKRGIRQNKHIVLTGFSLDRNAMLVKIMNDFRKEGLKPEVLVDSPLTMVQLGHYQRAYAEGSAWFKDMGKEPFDVTNFTVLTSYRKHAEAVINGEGPRVIITASANGNGGRIIDYFNHGIQRDDYVFVFCGWINPASPSSILHEAPKDGLVEILGGKFKKRCKTARLHGFTSHGYMPEVRAILDECEGLETIILNHARYEEKLDIQDELSLSFTGDILMPKVYQALELWKGGSAVMTEDECQMAFDEIFNIMNLPDLADDSEVTRESLQQAQEEELLHAVHIEE